MTGSRLDPSGRTGGTVKREFHLLLLYPVVSAGMLARRHTDIFWLNQSLTKLIAAAARREAPRNLFGLGIVRIADTDQVPEPGEPLVYGRPGHKHATGQIFGRF